MTVIDESREGLRSLADDLRAHDEARPRSRQSEDARADGKIGLGPSDYGRCRAQIAYRERPPADYVPDAVSSEAAIVGTLIHEGITARRAELYPDRRYGEDVFLPGLDSPGHPDEYDPATRTVVDFKTAGDWVWERVSTGRIDGMPGDWGQTSLYALGLRRGGDDVDTLRLVYLWRDKGRSVEFERPYDEDEALAALSWLHDVADALEAGEEPGSERLPRDRSGPTRDPICALYCPAVRHCWKLDEVPEGRSPESYVVVGDDAERAGTVLADFLDAQAGASKATDRLDEIKALLTGLPEGVYPGGLVLEFAGGSNGRYKDDPEPSIAALRERAADLWFEKTVLELLAPDADPAMLTDDERADIRERAEAFAAGIVLPQKLVGKRKASPKVRRETVGTGAP